MAQGSCTRSVRVRGSSTMIHIIHPLISREVKIMIETALWVAQQPAPLLVLIMIIAAVVFAD